MLKKIFYSTEDFENFFDKRINDGKSMDEVFTLVYEENRGIVCAELNTICKNPKTAIKRFGKCLEEYPALYEWMESIKEWFDNGCWALKEENHYSFYIYEYEDEYYICLLLNYKFNDIPIY